MAFNFSGTFTLGQWEELRQFALIQSGDIQARIAWINRELLCVGVFSTIYDEQTNFPISFSASPDTSHAAKLLLAYRILGGTPERDMLLRTSDDPVYLTPAAPLNTEAPSGVPSDGFSDLFSNGKRFRGTQRFDRDIGVPMEKFKRFQLEAIKRKREHLEFKIKRALDYSDQLEIESILLQAMIAQGTIIDVPGQIANLTALFHRPGAMNVIDNVNDLFGFGIGRPGDTSQENSTEVAASAEERIF